MSFELFLQRFDNGQPSGIPLAAIRVAFAGALTEPEEDFWQASYGPTQTSDLFLAPLADDPSQIHTISIYRPCADARLHDAIWQLLALPGSCLHFPGGAAPFTRDGRLGAALPPGMIEALGPPLVIGSAAEIQRLLGDDLS